MPDTSTPIASTSDKDGVEPPNTNNAPCAKENGSKERATEEEATEERATEKETTKEKLRRHIHPGRIVQIDGRPVRLTGHTLGPVPAGAATIVEQGPFPISSTGFRRVIIGPFVDPEVSKSEAEDLSSEELYDYMLSVLEGTPEEKAENLQSAIHRCNTEKPEAPEESPIGTLVSFTSPSRRKLAGLILTAGKPDRTDLIEAASKQYEQVVRLPQTEAVKTKIGDHPRWTFGSYVESIERAEETLSMLREAQSSLFGGAPNFEPMIETAPRRIRGVWTEGRIRPDVIRTVRDARQALREELDTDAIGEENVGRLAQIADAFDLS